MACLRKIRRTSSVVILSISVVTFALLGPAYAASTRTAVPAPTPTGAPGDAFMCYAQCFLAHGPELYAAARNYQTNWNRANGGCCTQDRDGDGNPDGQVIPDHLSPGLNGCAAPAELYKEYSDCMMRDMALQLAQIALTVAQMKLHACLQGCEANEGAD